LRDCLPGVPAADSSIVSCPVLSEMDRMDFMDLMDEIVIRKPRND
jgi:hypothetical protein